MPATRKKIFGCGMALVIIGATLPSLMRAEQTPGCFDRRYCVIEELVASCCAPPNACCSIGLQCSDNTPPL